MLDMLRKFNRHYKILLRTRLFFTNLLGHLLCLKNPNKWSVAFLSNLNRLYYPTSNGSLELKLLCNTDILLYRAKTVFDKEPETNLWIEGMPKDGVFYDVGANIGIFSILAAKRCRKVYAFEPVSFNYSILNQNLLINQLGDKAKAYCLAVGRGFEFNTMRLSSDDPGSAHHTFGSNLNVNHKQFAPVFEQGSLSVSLDELVYKYNFECPTYLKIDVDGNENLIISGAAQVLADQRLKSILIELNKDLSVDKNVVEKIIAAGFKLKIVGEESLFEGNKIGNVIFER